MRLSNRRQNPVRPSKGMAEGGCGGNSAIPLQKIEASPAALLVQSRTQQKSFLFLLEEKIGRAQNQKRRENFFAGLRVVASGGGAASFVGGFPKMRSDFVQGVDAYKKLTTIWSWGRLADKNTAGCSGCHLKTFYCPLERRS